MVTKKNPEPLDTTNVTPQSKPPYPISPNDASHAPASASSVFSPDLNHSPAFDLIDMREARSRPRRDSDVSSHGTWDTDDEEDKQEEAVEIPQPLRITPSKQNLGEQPKSRQEQDIPAILKPGPAHPPTTAVASMDHLSNQTLANPWADDAQRLTPQTTGRSQSSNNPYLKPKLTGEVVYQPWSAQQSVPQQPQTLPPPPPVELPASSTPSQELAQLSLGSKAESSQPAVPQTPISQTIPRKPVSPVQNKSQSTLSPVVTQSTSAQAADAWQQPASPTAQQKWGDESFYPPPPGPPPATGGQLIDHEPTPSQSTIPPRTLPPISTQQANSTSFNDRVPETPGTIERRQRSEHYQIKHINWQDGNATSIRQSPILTQNANGPCPLLALVNALVLTTPANANTALVETLRTREQVSLGLLLDAVFDELMSGRRGDSASALPDVSDLYSFLLALHTGMNVNPRFVAASSRSGLAANMNGVQTGSQTKAGSFEETREMKLYSTFSIPLIHGWIPPKNTAAYQAFDRRAQSFEDAQNIQFAESELEDKLQAQGLSGEEQQILQDIQTIKHFLATWPTQLTDHGLQAISSTLRPGQFAILFRNDHFSTIYKEPAHGALMTLVTDAGYSSHDEIVWESLVDVNGAASELFSGDFRTVSHNQDMQLNQQSSAGGEENWQTVQSRSRYRNQRPSGEVPPPLPGPRPNEAPAAAEPSTEQEDHDFALALQLQEEEDARQRQQQEQRRREQQLSEQFLSGQNEGRPPAIPPRRGGSRQSTSTRPAVNRPGDNFDPDAPPTYEQSASDRPYREGNGQSSPLNAYDALRRQQEQQSAYAAQSANSPTIGTHGRRSSYGNRFGRRTSQVGSMPGGFDGANGRRPGQAATTQDAEERCVLM